MTTPITLLQLSPTMTEGTIVRWLVKEGDKISAGDILAEIETDKAVMEQESFDDGTVLKLLVAEGKSIAVGGKIAVIGEPGEEVSADGNGSSAAETKEDDKKDDDKKAEPKKESPKAEKKSDDKKSDEKKADKPAAPARKEGERIAASPLARKIATEHGVDLAGVAGSGPGGRIVRRDIEEAIDAGAAPATRKGPAAPQQEDVEVALSGMRKTIARRLVQSRQEVPSFSLTAEANAARLLDGVARLKEKYPDDKVTVSHVIIKAMGYALMKHEWLRTQWVDGKLIRKAGAHVSVAVAIEDGLLTPVIRNVETKGLVAIAHELRELAAKARSRKLTEADLTGGVQTLSNLGMFGIPAFDAIINPPEATILAVGGIVDRPIVENGQLVPGKILTLTLSCDHRVVDGAVGASYLMDLKAALEDPLLILS